MITILHGSEPARVEEIRNTVRGILERNEVELVKEDDWGVRKLNYDIKDQNSGHFILHHCKINPARVKDLTHELELELGIMRYMLKRAA